MRSCSSNTPESNHEPSQTPILRLEPSPPLPRAAAGRVLRGIDRSGWLGLLAAEAVSASVRDYECYREWLEEQAAAEAEAEERAEYLKSLTEDEPEPEHR